MLLKKLNISICLSMLFTVLSFAQTEVKSIIKSFDLNSPLSGVIVEDLSTNKSVITSADGKFTIQVEKKNQLLKISFYGYESKVINASQISNVVFLEPHLESLNQVVLSASRTKEKKHDIPVAISVVSKKTIEEMQPNDVSEVLNQKPGVLMVDLGNEQHAMAIRQPMSYKSVFLYLEDGLPIRPTGVFNHNALLEMNLSASENIEIIRGAYSSLYGSEAIGGAVNFITQKPSKEFNVSLSNRVNNIGYKRVEGTISGTINNKTGLYLNAYRAVTDDGFRDYGDFEKTAVTAKLTHQFNEKLNIENSLTLVDYRSDTSGSISEEAYFDRDYSSIHSFTFRDAFALRIASTLNYTWNENNNSFLKLFYRDNAMKQNPTYRISSRIENGTTVKDGELNNNSFNSYGALFQHNSIVSDEFKYSVGGVLDYTQNTFVAEELNVTRNEEGIFSSYETLGTFIGDYDADLVNTGGFFTGEYKVTPRFRINGGLRIDAFNYYFQNNIGSTADYYAAPNSNDTFWSVTPRIGIVYNQNTNGVYANYSKGFVPPSVGELYNNDNGDVALLDPAKFNNFEVGGFVSLLENRIYLDGAVYYLRGNDEIINTTVLDEETGLDDSVNTNAGSTEHYGIELLTEVKLTSELKLKLSESVSKHKFVDYVEEGTDYSGKDMSRAPSYTSNIYLTYKPKYLKGFHIGTELQSLGSYYTDNTSTIEYDGHHLLNLRAGYKYKQVYFWVNLINATDELYSNSVSTGWGSTTYTPGAPRNVTLGVKISLK